jgi:hypothetical protein
MLTINGAFLVGLDSGLYSAASQHSPNPDNVGGILPPTLRRANQLPRDRTFSVKLPALRHVVAIMEKPTDLNKYRKRSRKARGSGNTLCRSGFHKWVDDGSKQFDVKQGRLVSRQRCQRCDATRVNLS